MKKALVFSLIIIAIVAGSFFWFQTTHASIGNMNIYSGAAEITRSGKTNPGKTGSGLKPHDKIKVLDKSRVSIILNDGSTIRLEAGTEIEVQAIEYNGKQIKNAVFSLTIGRIWSKPKPIAHNGEFQIETPHIQATVRGTSFNTDYLNQTNIVYVFQHQVKVDLLSKPDDTKTILSGEYLVIPNADQENQFAQGPKPVPIEYIDDWIKFNQLEDQKLDPAIQVNDQKVPTTETPPTTDLITPALDAPKIQTTPTATTPKTTTPNPAIVTNPTSKKITSLNLTAVNYSLDPGSSTLLKVTATYNDGSTAQVGDQVTWIQKPEIGTIKSPGWYTAVNPGTATISASLSGVNSNPINITINQAKKLSSISVSFTKDYRTQAALPPAQFKATAYWSDNTSSDITNTANWTAQGTAGGSINANGYYTPKTQGTDTVTASYQGVNGSTRITSP